MKLNRYLKSKIVVANLIILFLISILPLTRFGYQTYLPSETASQLTEIALTTNIWKGNGAPVCMAANDQDNVQMCSDGFGGAIITWSDRRNGLNWDIYAQRINSNGAVLWTANGVAVCTASSDQDNPQICSDGAGGAIITWQDKRSTAPTNWHIYAQRINSTGTIQWAQNGVALHFLAGEDRTNPQLCSDGLGGAIIAWLDDNYYCRTQRINSTGAKLWNSYPDGISLGDVGSVIPEYIGIQICSDGASGAIIAWSSYHSGFPSYYDVKLQKINSTGSVKWASGGVFIEHTLFNTQNFRICSDGSGGAIIVSDGFSFLPSPTPKDIWLQRILSTGARANGIWYRAICNTAGHQINPRLCSDGTGGVIITWEDYRSGANANIYAQRINSTTPYIKWTANGTAICTAINNQTNPEICSDGTGGAFIVWQDARDEALGNDIYIQRIDSSGTPKYQANGTAICKMSNKQNQPKLCMSGSEGALVAWTDLRWSNWDIFCLTTKPLDFYIVILNNNDFSNYASEGNGTASAPWIIENYFINANGGIFINNTNAYFILRNCTIRNANGDAGIMLNNVSQGVLLSNIIYNATENGIFLKTCLNIRASYNNVSYLYGIDGIHLENCQNSTITYTNISNVYGSSGIHLENCQNSTIAYTNISNVYGSSGIHLENCQNNTIAYINISNVYGINGTSAVGRENGYPAHAIYLIDSNGNLIRNNSIACIYGGNGGKPTTQFSNRAGGNGGTAYGISLIDSKNTSIVNNSISNIMGGIGGDTWDCFGYGWLDGCPGGPGGAASGIYLNASPFIENSRNIIHHISGGNGGKGCENWTSYSGGGRGGRGGNGGSGTGISVEEVLDIHSNISIVINNFGLIMHHILGGMGGKGGNGMDNGNYFGGIGGRGGDGGSANGIFIERSNYLRNAENGLDNITGGRGGMGGNGGTESFDCGIGGEGGNGGSANGIFLDKSNNSVNAVNDLENIFGGSGGTGGSGGGSGYSANGERGGDGGSANGIYINKSNNLINDDNSFDDIFGGKGGVGGNGGFGYYFGSSGGSGGDGGSANAIFIERSNNTMNNGTGLNNISGGGGGAGGNGGGSGDGTGGAGGWGGDGGNANGIFIEKSNRSINDGNGLHNIFGGGGGGGGWGGNGGAYDNGGGGGGGGNGGDANGIFLDKSNNSINAVNGLENFLGGKGGAGGNGGIGDDNSIGGTGGRGGNGGDTNGIFIEISNKLTNERNSLDNISGGGGGAGGNGGGDPDWRGGVGGNGGYGGSAKGIFTNKSNILINDGNNLGNIFGGTGAAGGNGGNLTSSNPLTGSSGGNGGSGGAGGFAIAIYIAKSVNISNNLNNISNIIGNSGGRGGNIGSGLPPSTPGIGGFGGKGGSSSGIYYNQSYLLMNSKNTLYNFLRGLGGLAGFGNNNGSNGEANGLVIFSSNSTLCFLNNISYSAGIGINFAYNCHDNHLYNNRVINNSNSGIYINSNGWQNNITANYLEFNHEFGIMVAGNSNYFYFNIIWENTPNQIIDLGLGNVWVSNILERTADYDSDNLSNIDEFTLGTNLFAPDTDGDSMPDGWEVTNALNPLNASDAMEDPDSDGLTNRGEFLNGTQIYNPDSDEDGLWDGPEVFFYGTSPINNDTDSDFIPDEWEVLNDTNPLVPDSFLDYDNDNLANYFEYLYKTDPWLYDTDNDGHSDGEEILFGTNPLDPNSHPTESSPVDYTLPILLGLTFAGIAIALAIILHAFLTKKPKKPTSNQSKKTLDRGTPPKNPSDEVKLKIK